MTQSFEQKLKKINSLKNGIGLANLIDEASKILANPLFVFDTSYTLFAHTKGSFPEDRIITELLEMGTFSQETVDFFSSEHFITAFAESEVVSVMKSDKLKFSRLNGKLFDSDNIQIGNLSAVEYNHPFEQGDIQLFEALCEIVSVELCNSEHYGKIERVFEESHLVSLVEGNTDKIEVKQLIAQLYDDLKSNIWVAVIDISKYDSTFTHLAYFRDVFRKIQPQHTYFVGYNSIFAIISSDSTVPKKEVELPKLKGFFEKYNMCAGISSRFQNLHDFQKHCRQAINALNYGQKSLRKSPFYFYDDFRLEIFLNSTADKTDIASLFHPLVALIREYDKNNGTRLLPNLYQFMSCGLDMELASKEGNIDLNQFKKDMDFLEKEFRFDWKNGEMLAGILMTIKLTDEQYSQ